MQEALCPSPGTFQGFLVAWWPQAQSLPENSSYPSCQPMTFTLLKIPGSLTVAWKHGGLLEGQGTGHWSHLALVAHVDWMIRGLRVRAWPGGCCTVHVGSPATLQFSSVAQSCPTLGDPMNCSTPGLPVHHQLPEFTQTSPNL